MFKTLQSVAALLLSFGLFIMANGLFSTLLGVRTTIEGFSTGTTGIIVASYFFGLLLGARYAVQLVGIGGYIRTFAAFASMMSISALLLVIWVDPYAWMAIRMLAGFCMAGLVMITESWLNERADSSMRGQLLSFYMITNYLGSGCGQFLLPLADPGEFHLFSLVSIIFSLALIPILMTRSVAPPPPRPTPVKLRALFRLSPVSVVGAFCAGWIGATNNGLGPVLTREIGMSLGGTSVFMFCLIFSGLLLQWPIGHLSDRFDRRRVLLVVALITLGSSGLMVVAINLIDQYGSFPLFVLAVIFGSTFYTIHSISSAHIADNAAAAGEGMAAVVSGMLLVYGSGAIIGPIVTGQIMARVGPHGMFLSIAVMLLLLCLFVVYRRYRRVALLASQKLPFVPVPGTQFTGASLYGAARREVDRAFSMLVDSMSFGENTDDSESDEVVRSVDRTRETAGRITSYPEGHWSLKIDIPYSMGVRQGGLVFTSGQADLTGMGEVCHPGDLYKQTAEAITHIKTIFADLGSDIERLVKLTVFYVDNGEVDQCAYTVEIARLLGTKNRPVVAMVPLSHFFYSGLLVEIDAVGVDSDAPRKTVADPAFGQVTPGLSQALRCGEFIFIGGTSAVRADGTLEHPGDSVWQTREVLARLEKILAEFGADRRDLVKLNNWFVIGGNAREWSQSARVRADFYHRPGPVATGNPLHSLGADGVVISTDCWAMLGADGKSLPRQYICPEGHWNWPIPMPFQHGLKCGNVIFVGGQVSLDEDSNVIDPGKLVEQTRISMENIRVVLAGFGADFSSILKLNTWYRGINDTSGDADALHASVNIRSAYFQKPGPASTGIPLDSLCYEGLLTETEVIAFLGD